MKLKKISTLTKTMKIGISGKARSGKDAVGKLLLKYLPSYRRLALADGIKKEFSAATGLSLTTVNRIKTCPRVRTSLIYLGEFRKQNNPEYWINFISNEDNIIVPDIRFQVEKQTMKDTLFIRVECPQALRAERGILSNENHYSECELDDIGNWDYTIMNDSTESDLEQKVRNMISELKLI